MTTEQQPINVFLSYASKDRRLFEQLTEHLSLLKREGIISTWDDRQMVAGTHQSEMMRYLEQASLILLLVSPAFFASDYCYQVEMKRALERHEAGEAHALPIVVRPCVLSRTPLVRLDCLPSNGKAVTRWSKQDLAWEDVMAGILQAIEGLHGGLPLPQRIKQDEMQGAAELIKRTDVSRNTADRSSSLSAGRREELRAQYIEDHTSIIREKLSAFVGRQHEREEIRALIASTQETGGYVTIHGQAGQGKSSIIAKMVDEYGVENVAHYFIPINADVAQQNRILYSIMTRLILNYDLPETHIPETEVTLRTTFHNVLEKLAGQKKQEVIFIDGLDQLPVNEYGKRNLSFLPDNPPEGIVFVLGTRPDDTLEELEMLKPNRRYPLPNLTSSDFDLLLQQHNIQLAAERRHQIYQTLQGALYLKLATEALAESGNTDAEIAQIIKELTENPDSLFSHAVRRWQEPLKEWQEILKPVLGILMVAHSPLSMSHICEITHISIDSLKINIQRLGGFLTKDAKGYTLFHLKFREYLQNQQNLLFTEAEMRSYHAQLAEWCEQEKFPSLWEPGYQGADQEHQERCQYARYHYITHLYHAHAWTRLFEVLDDKECIRKRMRSSDPDLHTFAQDLDLGRCAIVESGKTATREERIQSLPRLWFYTLIRYSLTRKSGLYPPGAYRLLLLLNRKQEALGLVDLLIDNDEKAKTLVEMAQEMVQQATDRAECIGLLSKAKKLVSDVKEQTQEQGQILKQVVTVLVRLEQWQLAAEAAMAIQQTYPRAEALRDIGDALARAGQLKDALDLWQQAIQVIQLRKNTEEKFQFNYQLGKVFAYHKQDEQAQTAWLAALKTLTIINDSKLQQRGCYCIASELVHIAPDNSFYRPVIEAIQSITYDMPPGPQKDRIVLVLKEIFFQHMRTRSLPSDTGEDTFGREQAWNSALAAINALKEKEQKARSMYELVQHLIHCRQWTDARSVIDLIEKKQLKAQAYIESGEALAVEQDPRQALEAWTLAEEVIGCSAGYEVRIRLLCTLAEALAYEQGDQQPQGIWQAIEEQVSDIEVEHLNAFCLLLLGRLFHLLQQPEQARLIWARAKQCLAILQHSAQNNSEWQIYARVLMDAREWELAEEIMIMLARKHQWTQASDELLGVLLHAQRWDAAHAIIKAIPDVQKRSVVYYESASSMRQHQHLDQSLPLSCAIEARDLRVQSLSELWLELIRHGQDQQAQAVQERIERTIVACKGNQPQKDRARYHWSRALLASHHLDRAYQVITAISTITLRGEALIELWHVLSQGKGQRQAKQVWSHIAEIVPVMQSDQQATYLLRRLSDVLVSNKQWKMAYTYVQAIEDEEARAAALQHLVEALTFVRDWKAARTVIDAITITDYQVAGLLALAHGYYRERPVETAYPIWAQVKKLIAAIEDSEQRDRNYRLYAHYLIQAQEWKRASAIITAISNADQRAEMQQLCVKAVVQGNQWDHVLTVIDPMHPARAREQALCVAGKALCEANEWERARTIINRIKHSELTLEELIEVWKICVWAQEAKKARNVWSLLEQAVTEMVDPRQQIQLLERLAGAAARVKQWEMVLELIETFETQRKYIDILREIGAAAARAHYKEQAEAAWEKAEHAIDGLRDQPERLRALCKLGDVLTQAQERERASAIWSKALQVMDANHDISLPTLCLLAKVLAQAQQWDKAEAVWKKAESTIAALPPVSEEHIAACYYIGEAYARMDMNVRAEIAWLKAEESVVDAINTSEQQLLQKLLHLEKLAEAFARIDQKEHCQRCWQTLIECSQSIEDSQIQRQYLQELVKRLLDAQQCERAFDVISSISDSKLQKSFCRIYAPDFIVAQQWDYVLAIMGVIASSQLEPHLLCAMVEGLVQAGSWEQAYEIVDSIKESSKRAQAWCALGIGLVQAGQTDLVTDIWQQLERAITSIGMSSQLTQALREIGKALAVAQKWDEAKQVINAIVDPWQQVQCLITLGEASYARDERREQEQPIWWNKAQALLEERIGSQRERAQGLILLAKAYAQNGKEDAAGKLWHDAESIIAAINDKEMQAQALHTLAENLAQTRQWDRAYAIAMTITVDDLRARVLGRLVEELARYRELGRAEAVCENIQDEEQRARAFVFLAGAYATNEKLAIKASAPAMLRRAERAIGDIKSEPKKVEPLSALGRVLDRQHRARPGQTRWDEAEGIIGRMNEGLERSWAIRSLGSHIASAKEYDKLLCLIQQSWSQVKTREDANVLFPLVSSIIVLHPSLGVDLYEIFTRVDSILKET